MANQESEKYNISNIIKESKLTTDSFITDDEDDTNYETIPNYDSKTCCYQRRGRVSVKESSKPFKNGHNRTKSEGSAMFKQDKRYISGDTCVQTNFPGLTNVEMLSHLGHTSSQISRRRVQSISRDRDLSPSEVVRQYISKEKEDMDIMIGRIVHNVEDLAEVAAKKASEGVKTIYHNVHDKAEAAAAKPAIKQALSESLRLLMQPISRPPASYGDYT